MIAFVISAHDAVPDVEVQAIVAVHMLVVHGVMGGGIAPEGVYPAREAAPEKLIARMPTYIQHQLVHAPCQYGQWMKWYSNHHDGQYHDLHDCLCGVK